MRSPPLSIVIASHTHLGAPWVVGSHHLARAWARDGHRVLLLSAPVTPWHAVRASDPIVRARFRRLVEGVQEAEPNLWHCVPFGLLPWVWGAKVHEHLEHALPSFTVALAEGVADCGFLRPDLLVIDHPQFYNLDLEIHAGRFAYRCADLFAEVHERAIVDSLQRALLARVDCTIATSAPVAQRLRELGARRVTVVENGVEFAHFAAAAPPPPEYEALGPHRAVYVGAIDFRFDGTLLVRLARARPDVDFVLIGDGDALPLSATLPLRNVHRLGTRAYATVPAFLQHASVGLLPFNAHPANAGRSPMKFYEYAAAGLTVAATRTPELERRREPFVAYFEQSAPERALDRCITSQPRPDPPAVAARDWHHIADRVLALAMDERDTMPLADRHH